jgi:hypothetical protein
MNDDAGAAQGAGGGQQAGAGRQGRSLHRAHTRLVAGIGVYLVLMAFVSIYVIVAIFPQVEMRPLDPAAATAAGRADAKWEALIDLEFNPLRIAGWTIMSRLEPAQGLLLLAILSGVLGSFMHAAQSFAMYVGNQQLTPSWAWWYLFRPPIGAVLGLLFYFVLRAGLLTASVEAVSPYGVVAFGALAGWFSKQATDKLAEVFENLFRTEKTREYRDRLSAAAPRVTRATISEAPAPSTDTILTIEGEHFQTGATAVLDRTPLATTVTSPTQLTARVPAAKRPPAGAEVELTVQNQGPGTVPSPPFTVKF